MIAKSHSKIISTVYGCALCAALLMVVAAGPIQTDDVLPSGVTAAKTPIISYHGGPVMLGTPNLYLIWYGDFLLSDQTILQNFVSSIGGSPYFDVNTTYYEKTPQKTKADVSGLLKFAGQASFPNTLMGTHLTDSNVEHLVSTALSQKALPTDPNGIYLVLTDPTVTETSGFCRTYCYWHTYKSTRPSFVYGFIGDPQNLCPSACAAQNPGPNTTQEGPDGVDAMVDHIAAALNEIVTDPELNAWYGKRGEENSDKCAWTYGSTQMVASNGSLYNVTLQGYQYLIQQNWVNAADGGYCALHYP
jgi:Phosphate-induced protein 1 conserved region